MDNREDHEALLDLQIQGALQEASQRLQGRQLDHHDLVRLANLVSAQRILNTGGRSKGKLRRTPTDPVIRAACSQAIELFYQPDPDAHVRAVVRRLDDVARLSPGPRKWLLHPLRGPDASVALTTLRRYLASVFSPTTLAEATGMIEEAANHAHKFLLARQTWIGDLAQTPSAHTALWRSHHPAVRQYHFEAPTGRRKVRVALISRDTLKAIHESHFWELRYPPESFHHAERPRMLRVWADQHGPRKTLVITGILFATSTYIGSNQRPDSITYMLIMRNEPGDAFKMLRMWLFDCLPTSFAHRLVFASDLDPQKDLPNLGGSHPHTDHRDAMNVVALIGQLRRGESRHSLKYSTTTKMVNHSVFEKAVTGALSAEVLSPVEVANLRLSPLQLAERLDWVGSY